jgi:putative YphP/YqiW family bacilliredoxin
MFNIMSRPPLYDQDAVQPMRDALIAVGFKQMITPKDVDEAINVNDDQTVLVMINSVCGCAAGSARPGVSLALQHSVIPDRLITGFAGQEREAVDKIRQYITGYPPSSPIIAMFKNGKLMYFMQRYNIEGRSAEEISSDLREAFDELCTKQGPSIPHDVFEKVTYAVQCGSKIPLYKA